MVAPVAQGIARLMAALLLVIRMMKVFLLKPREDQGLNLVLGRAVPAEEAVVIVMNPILKTMAAPETPQAGVFRPYLGAPLRLMRPCP